MTFVSTNELCFAESQAGFSNVTRQLSILERASSRLKQVAAHLALVASIAGCANITPSETAPERPTAVIDMPAPARAADHPELRRYKPAIQTSDPARFTIFPVTINAEGFESVEKSPEELVADTGSGWLELEAASRGALSPETIIDVQPPRRITIPGLRSSLDLCDNEKVGGFRRLLTEMVLPKKGGGTPIVVLEQKSDVPCGMADGGPGAGIVVYDASRFFEPEVLAHEMGHTLNLHHSNMLKFAEGSSTIDTTSKNEEYSDPFTILSYRRPVGDADPFAGVTLKQLGALPASEIRQLVHGQTEFRLSSLSGNSGKTRLAHLPIKPTRITVDEKTGATATISNIYFELSSTFTGKNPINGDVSLKIYGEEDSKTLPHTFLIPAEGLYSFDANSVGSARIFRIGGLSIGFAMKFLRSYGDGTGWTQLLVDVRQPDTANVRFDQIPTS